MIVLAATGGSAFAGGSTDPEVFPTAGGLTIAGGISGTGRPADSGFVAIREQLGTYLPDDLVFTDENGRVVRLLNLIDKPTVISPVYYNCPGLCTPIMDGIAKLMNRTDLEAGKDFQVIDISFHEGETPELAGIKKRNYVGLLDDRKAGDAWYFLTGDEADIRSLIQSLGYSVIRRGQDILHPAAKGKIMPSIPRVMKMCFNYEPEGKARQRTMTILGFILMISIGLILIIVYPPLKNKNQGTFPADNIPLCCLYSTP